MVYTSSEKIITKKVYYKKKNYYKFYYKIENLSRAFGGGIHVLSSEKITKKNDYKIENLSKASGLKI